VVAVPAPARLRLREGTEVHLTLDEPLSSKTAAEGDRFKITVAEPITLDDGAVIPAGYRGRGEVSAVERPGMMGKAGQLNVRLDYILIGDVKITPLFLLMKGKEATIPRGQALVGYVDDDVTIAQPLAAPPPQTN
jgi:hypothetical protein